MQLRSRSGRLGAALETGVPHHTGGLTPHRGQRSGTVGGVPNGWTFTNREFGLAHAGPPSTEG